MAQSTDLIIAAHWVIPVEPRDSQLADHAVVIKDGRITAVLPSERATLAYPNTPVLSLPTHALLPGLINLHTHAAMSLMRGLADDLPLMQWLNDHIWPAEAKHVSPDFVYDGTLLACAEMLKGRLRRMAV